MFSRATIRSDKCGLRLLIILSCHSLGVFPLELKIQSAYETDQVVVQISGTSMAYWVRVPYRETNIHLAYCHYTFEKKAIMIRWTCK